MDNADTGPLSSSAPTNITLSDEARAYMAQAAKTTESPAVVDPPSIESVTADARTWFDQQYASLGIASAMLDGQVAVDFSTQTRATLSVVANNALGQFTDDETAAATRALQARFDDAMASHVVIARQTGDYASLYRAASHYLDQAGTDEKATPAWQNQNEAVQQGLAAAKVNFGTAPATGNDSDRVRALLDRTSTPAPAAADSAATSPAGNARKMLDAQASRAKDNGTELVFSPARSGQQVDFSDFDNRTLAIMALNTDGTFSAEEPAPPEPSLASAPAAAF